ncbi:MAG: hypothetical protein F4Z28_18040 [Gammaproteobacteria bacterium]|nr:hypothetical protein [Gammaproteobacteria bacterium]
MDLDYALLADHVTVEPEYIIFGAGLAGLTTRDLPQPFSFWVVAQFSFPATSPVEVACVIDVLDPDGGTLAYEGFPATIKPSEANPLLPQLILARRFENVIYRLRGPHLVRVTVDGQIGARLPFEVVRL